MNKELNNILALVKIVICVAILYLGPVGWIILIIYLFRNKGEKAEDK